MGLHAEVLELLAERIAHHGARLGFGLDREPLLIPPIASASSVSEAHSLANVRVAEGSSSGGSWC